MRANGRSSLGRSYNLLPKLTAAFHCPTIWRFFLPSKLLKITSALCALRTPVRRLHTIDSSSTQLVLLEPHFDHLTSLPILKPAAEIRNGLATPTREKRVTLKTGIEWIFGDVVGLIQREGGTSPNRPS
jgi:hypothetical protein